MVGALLVEPRAPGCAAGMIFFNNVGALGMCGHGTIGVVATLAHLGRLAPGRHRLDTPVGVVETELHGDGRVTVHNVPAWRQAAGVTVQVPGVGPVTGDVAWGGNWFFLVDATRLPEAPAIALAQVEALTGLAWRIRQALVAAGVTGAEGAEIDHVELFAPAAAPADARNFVLCPGKAYDRSPCGTGTSAKVACLAAAGELEPGKVWRQESIVGSVFEASYARDADLPADQVVPTIRGSAYVSGQGTLLFGADDPFAYGLQAL